MTQIKRACKDNMIEVIKKYYIEEQCKEFAGIINAIHPKTLTTVFHYFY